MNLALQETLGTQMGKYNFAWASNIECLLVFFFQKNI